MFTGIVEQLGTVRSLRRSADSARLLVEVTGFDDVAAGDSVAVNGVCLTAAGAGADSDGRFEADVMAETLDRSTLGSLRPGDAVNLERPLTPTGRIGGHIVQGHVDGVAAVRTRRPSEHWDLVTVELPTALTRYVVEKGSIGLDGVSLTVASVDGDLVSVSLIPETLARTTLGQRAVGDQVNVEVDVMAKYVEKLLEART